MRLGYGFAGLVVLTGISAPAGAVLPDDIAVGTRAEVEGRLDGEGRVLAREVELDRAPTGVDELEGRIDAVDASGRRLRVAGVEVALEEAALVTDDDGGALALGDVRVGHKADLKGAFADGVFRARELEVEPPQPGEEDEVELKGTIAEANSAFDVFRLLGLTVKVTSETEVELD
jgi:hypothetical protein